MDEIEVSTTTIIVPLSNDQKVRLSEQEVVIHEYLEYYYRAGKAVRIIHDEELYTEYGTFEEYADKRWKRSPQSLYRLMNASVVYDNVLDTGWTPENEAQARPLTSKDLTIEDQQLIATFIHETAADKADAAHVQALVDVVKEIKLTGAIDGGDGESIPINQATIDHVKLALTEEQTERLARQIQRLKDRSSQKFVSRFYGIPIVRGSDSIEVKLSDESELQLGQEYVFMVYKIEQANSV